MPINNPLSFSPSGSEPLSTPTSRKEGTPSSQDQVIDVAIEQLKEITGEGNYSPNLKSKSVVAPPLEEGVWDSIVKFFNRRFSEVTEAEQEEAQKINLMIGKVEQEINKMDQLAKQASLKEQALKGKYPSDQSVDVTATYLTKAQLVLVKAKNHLLALKTKEHSAYQLAEDHAAFDALPGHIQRVEENVNYLEAKLEFIQKLFDLEIAIKDYKPQETWDQFVKVRDQRKSLTETFREMIEKNPAFKENPEAQKYLQLKAWSSDDLYQLGKSIFPGLKSQVERLLDSSVEIHDKRIEKLDNQMGTLKPLFSQYNKLSQRINDLENSIYGNTILSKISRLIHGESKLKEKLQKKKIELAVTYKNINDNAKFKSTEVDWLNGVVKLQPEKLRLLKDINAMQEGLSYLKVRHSVSIDMNKLHRHLEFFRDHNQVVEESFDSNFIDFKKLNAILSSDIQNLAKDMQGWQIQQNKLPSKFAKMDILSQLKVQISVSFPALEPRVASIFRMIEEKALHEELNQAIADKTKIKRTPVLEDLEADEDEIIEDASLTKSAIEATEENQIFSPPPTPPPFPKTMLHEITTGAQTVKELKKKFERIDVEDTVEETDQQTTEPSNLLGRIQNGNVDLDSDAEAESTGSSTLLSQIQGSVLKKTAGAPKEGFAGNIRKQTLMSQIKAGLTLKKTSKDPIKEVKTEEETTLFSQIHKGIKLNPVSTSGDHIPPPKQKPKFEQFLEQIEAEELKIKDISEKDWDELSFIQQTALNIAERRISFDPPSESKEDEDNDEWLD